MPQPDPASQPDPYLNVAPSLGIHSSRVWHGTELETLTFPTKTISTKTATTNATPSALTAALTNILILGRIAHAMTQAPGSRRCQMYRQDCHLVYHANTTTSSSCTSTFYETPDETRHANTYMTQWTVEEYHHIKKQLLRCATVNRLFAQAFLPVLWRDLLIFGTDVMAGNCTNTKYNYYSNDDNDNDNDNYRDGDSDNSNTLLRGRPRRGGTRFCHWMGTSGLPLCSPAFQHRYALYVRHLQWRLSASTQAGLNPYLGRAVAVIRHFRRLAVLEFTGEWNGMPHLSDRAAHSIMVGLFDSSSFPRRRHARLGQRHVDGEIAIRGGREIGGVGQQMNSSEDEEAIQMENVFPCLESVRHLKILTGMHSLYGDMAAATATTINTADTMTHPQGLSLGRILREKGWSAAAVRRLSIVVMLTVPALIDMQESIHALAAICNERHHGSKISVDVVFDFWSPSCVTISEENFRDTHDELCRLLALLRNCCHFKSTGRGQCYHFVGGGGSDCGAGIPTADGILWSVARDNVAVRSVRISENKHECKQREKGQECGYAWLTNTICDYLGAHVTPPPLQLSSS